jgi:alpha-2-macroglobulin
MSLLSKRILATSLILFQCSGIFAHSIVVAQARRVPAPRAQQEREKSGLQIRLSEGSPAAESVAPSVTTPAERLSEADTQRILRRLRPIKQDPADEQSFSIRDRSLPPPQPGKTVTDLFPSPERPAVPDVNSGPLEVLRFSPEGDVALTSQLSVTFSQPMVSVTSHEEMTNVPVKLTPQPAGRWRWVGTSTLLFESDSHFPMATSYTAEIAAGTKSVSGSLLADAKSWKFATPSIQLKSSYPKDTTASRDPIMFVAFDQRIDPSQLVDKIRVQSGRREWKVRAATTEEIASDDYVTNLSAKAARNRWLAFKIVGDKNRANDGQLPSASRIAVSIGPGTPSAEGPLKSPEVVRFFFNTYGAFLITNHSCESVRCSPLDRWSIRFSNPIDPASWSASNVHVEELTPAGKRPQPVDLKYNPYGTTLVINGVKRGSSQYRLTLDPQIRDLFGQTLGKTPPIIFNVGSAVPALTGPDEDFVVLDPAAPPRLQVYSINQSSARVRLYKVGPESWTQYLEYRRSSYQTKRPKPPGRLVYSRTLPIKSRLNEIVQTDVDLSPALDRGVGQVFVVVEPLLSRYRLSDTVAVWAQVTQIGVDAFADKTDLLGWTTSLKDGKPLAGTVLSIESLQPSGTQKENSATTGADGLARIPLAVSASDKEDRLLVARNGNDVAILPETEYRVYQTDWVRHTPIDSLHWFVFDDRSMYRPGEEVHVKGWIRRVGGGKDGDVSLLNDTATKVSYSLKDSRGNETAKGEAQISPLGGFDAAFKLPPTMNLGYARLYLALPPDSERNRYTHTFQVQEFRRPEFEVSAQASEGPFFVGGGGTATVSAAYYAGGGLGNSDVVWNVTTSPARYTPPNRSEYTFGKWIPWWVTRPRDYVAPKSQSFSGRTDAAGKHTLKMDFDSVDPPQPMTVSTEATVTDVNRQAWTATTRLLVHPSDLYVGIRSSKLFVQAGEPLVVNTIVTDLDGKLIGGRTINLRAVLKNWIFEKGEWKQVESNPQECTVSSSDNPTECRFETKSGGEYQVTATIQDDRARRNESELTLWVAGQDFPRSQTVRQQDVELIPNRSDYHQGDTAEILVRAPFYPAEGLLTLRRSGVVSARSFTMDSPSTVLRFKIEEAYTPNIYVQVDLDGSTLRDDNHDVQSPNLPKRPSFARGGFNLEVPPVTRKLTVTATPRDKLLEPSVDTSIDVDVRDSSGKPVAGSELAIVVVDEAILALTNYKTRDPIAEFYVQRSADVVDHHLRKFLLLSRPDLAEKLQRRGYGVGGGTAGGVPGGIAGAIPPPAPPPPKTLNRKAVERLADVEDQTGATEPIKSRENFNPLAIFAPEVPTDANGHATVKIKLPDNLTRYRVMAIAVAGDKQFGANESSITARLPLMVRPSAPRFMNFGDKAELPIVLQNQTDTRMTVDVAVRAGNAELTDGAGRRVNVPANDRVEVRFPVSAARPGTARFQIAAVSGKASDAAEIELPVWTPATTESFAAYGVIDDGPIAQSVSAPRNAIKQFGGLEVSTSSTELQALTDAVIYLTSYQFECSEQLSSRVLAVAALKDVLAAFKAKGLPAQREIVDAVVRDIKLLESRQSENGSVGLWKRGDDAWPYISIHVAHALQRAKEKGFEVPSSMLDRSKKYLRAIDQNIPRDYSPAARNALVAYSLFVRNLMGDRDSARARRLIAEARLDGLSLESIGWLLSVFTNDPGASSERDSLLSYLNNRVTEEAATAHFVTSYKDDDYLLMNSERRADAVILAALIKDQPSSDLIPKIVRGLLAQRKQGRWQNTQENAFVLLALDQYFATYEKSTPDFVARAWLGQDYAGGHEFRGRTTERFSLNEPMKNLADNSEQQTLVLSKEGPGRMYYRVGLQYAPSNLYFDSAEHGFTVERSYEGVDKAADVRRDVDGTWHIKAGSRVRVRLTMLVPTRRYHVSLVDPLPAGLEPLNPALAVSGSIPRDPAANPTDRWWWLQRSWFEHQNIRDERVEAFASIVWEGVHPYSYVARATTPGTFIVPPAKAEEMYHPETFGRSRSDKVIVE